MHIYFDTAPAAAAKQMFDGHLYIHSQLEMCRLTDGKRHVREAKEPRLMRVARVANGVAFAELGKAGDAIACTDNLPFSVVAHHVPDEPQGGVQ